MLYLRRPFHDKQSTRSALDGRFRYSDLNEAAPRGSLWGLYRVEQVRMICEVAVGNCARQLQGVRSYALRRLPEAGEMVWRAFWAS